MKSTICFEMNVYSRTLSREVQVNVILPRRDPAEPYKTIWLLHGLAGNHTSFMRNTSIERYAAKYHMAVVMPNVDRSWYADTASDSPYFTYVTEELPNLCRAMFKGMSDKREDNIVAGISMGGYGAFKTALTYPDRYGYCICLSGALDITREGRPVNMNEWRSIFGFDIESPKDMENTDNDIYYLASRNKKAGVAFPEIYMWCGVDDHIFRMSENYHAHLDAIGVEHHYETSEGDHSWQWWDKHLQPALDYLFDNNAK